MLQQPTETSDNQGKSATPSKQDQELRAFLRVISHDFSGPVRYIREFGNLFLNRMTEKLGPDAMGEQESQFAEIMQENIHKLERMLDGISQYSRIIAGPQEVEAIDCSALIPDIKEQLTARYPDTVIILNTNELPEVFGNAAQITTLFQNLIENAIKYGDGSNVEISIEYSDNENEHRFKIADNGIGIAEEFHEEVLQIFRRLHTDDEYSGIGMGLAYCRKIVERHGGEIWIEAGGKTGVIIFFTLPKRAPEN